MRRTGFGKYFRSIIYRKKNNDKEFLPSTLETVDWTLVDWYLHVLCVRKES